MRSGGVVAVEECREVRETLIDPRELARVAVVVQQVLELVRDDTFVQRGLVVRRVVVAPLRVVRADPVRPVERVDDDDVHAGRVDVVRGEVARRVAVLAAVVVAGVLHVVDEHHERVTRRVVGIGGIHRPEVLFVDRDDLVRQLIAHVVDLRLGQRVVGGIGVGARHELVAGRGVERRVEAVDAGRRRSVEGCALGNVDVHGGSVGSHSRVGLRELLVVGAARLTVVDRDRQSVIAGAPRRAGTTDVSVIARAVTPPSIIAPTVRRRVCCTGIPPESCPAERLVVPRGTGHVR